MDKWLRDFFNGEMAGGVAMLAAAALAMLFANTALHAEYYALVHRPFLGAFTLESLSNDVLMPVFFLLVGLELKYEMIAGSLATPRQRLLPLIAALGGIGMPALLYLVITHSEPGLRHGWAIPTATDIAFAICVVNLAGKRVPAAAKFFLLAIAIYDDLAAILIIALFYSETLILIPLLAAIIVGLAMAFLNRRQTVPTAIYLILGIMLGLLLHHAGVHTTVAGMVTGLCIPLRGVNGRSPLQQLMRHLHPLVAFGVLPLFAFSNAGINFSGVTDSALLAPLPLAIAAGLLVGKQLGIFGASAIAIRAGFAPLPYGTSWRMLYAIALTAGIGFTMSLFIGQLAFVDAALHNLLKIGVFAGSLLSAIAGLMMLRLASRN